MLEVRAARVDELDTVVEFYTRMIDEMRGTDFDVRWRHGEHPSEGFLRASVEAGEVLVGALGADDPDAPAAVGASRLACALVMNGEADPGYERGAWQIEAAPRDVAVLHVVATLPAFHGRGFARQLVNASADAARASGKRAVRLDTFASNLRGRRLYESCGFACAGECPCFYPGIDPTLAAALYERVL
ncbi:GNAT family N-acetyltransferase [Gordonibacter sp. An230]|uniref:GNAT family N-acetyltransferase n=1 Tax=Gordonibacter sp. An230 TaxID=1965592 RepID=UPI000B380C18|nr:GNAT family N-acetyltransferase [Gordonibacter sp. An230]OUO89884.1 GNAT family N-acetyltransferase [Gordonibacter sp. An230]